MNKLFRDAQDEYSRLRADFEAGNIGAEEFDRALQQLVVEDGLGHLWMLGANTGQWYVFDGTDWAPGTPDDDATPRDAAAIPFGRNVPMGILAVIAVGAILLVLIFSIFFRQSALLASRDNFSAPTRRALPTAVAVVKTTAKPAPVTAVRPTAQPTPLFMPTESNVAPPTPLPTIPFYVEPIQSPEAVVIPTITPPRRNVPTVLIADVSPFSSPDQAPPGATPTPYAMNQPPDAQGAAPPPPGAPAFVPPPAGAGGLPPDVYVTALWVQPSPAQRRAPATFSANFLNTSGATRSYLWRIVILDPSKAGRNKDFGQSDRVSIVIPPGTSSASITFVPVSNGGSCFSLQALAAWQGNDTGRIYFASPNGPPSAISFDVC